MFSKLLIAAAASASLVSAAALPKVDAPATKFLHGGSSIDPVQYQEARVQCEGQKQAGLINVGVDACIVAELEALVAGTITHSKRTLGCSSTQYQTIKADCGHQQQEGLINIGVDACVVAGVEAILAGTLSDVVKRGQQVSPLQYQKISASCSSQKQAGLLNVGVDACILAEVEALLAGAIAPRTVNEKTLGPDQFSAINAECQEQCQEGLVNVGVSACVVAQVEALLSGSIQETKKEKRTNGDKISPAQFQAAQVKCSSQKQAGLINVGADACLVAELEAIVAGTITHTKRTLGCSSTQYQAIKADCGKQQQTGLINIGVDACVVAAVEALIFGTASEALPI